MAPAEQAQVPAGVKDHQGAWTITAKKLMVVVQPSAARSTGCPRTSRNPSRTRAKVDGRVGGGTSVTAIRHEQLADTRRRHRVDEDRHRRSTPAPARRPRPGRRPTSRPGSGSTGWSRPDRPTAAPGSRRRTGAPSRASAAPDPMSNATTYSWVSVRRPTGKSPPGASSTAARRRSAATSRRRLRVRRSTHAPRTTPDRYGVQISAVSGAHLPGVAASAVTAISGSASSEIRSPNCEIVSASQKPAEAPVAPQPVHR